MKVLVLGSGVIGVTAAYFLSRAGHDVTVVDRRAGPGEETSFANGGQISASLAEPWANPDVLRNLLGWLGRRNAPLAFHLRADTALWGWALRFLKNCTAERSAANLERALRLALYSRGELRAIRETTGIRYDERMEGVLKFYRSARDFESARRRMESMNALGANLHALDPKACLATEPALAAIAEEIAGAVYSPEDESGDAHAFTVKLGEEAARLGARFAFNQTIEALVPKEGRIDRVVTDRGHVTADAIVLSLGSYSSLLLRPLGMRLPIYPAKGYSVTLPIRDSNRAPSRSITDEGKKLVFGRFGDRLRVAGRAEFKGFDTKIEPARCQALARDLEAVFPGAADQERPACWAGLRPLTPDTLPILGPSPFSNLFLNTGHGTYGWTLAAGCGRILADLVEGARPAIEIGDFSSKRF
ncbi:MAG: D-amino acid dehydrogenase [Alphaproteobacteria bacterium]|nr:D-amino acid dehydrogenase [Alphaproteobacteria bacterium]